MTIQVLDPVGEVAPGVRVRPRHLDALHGRRIGLVFNHHPAAAEVWRRLEEEIQRHYRPPAIHRVAKTNVSAPAPRIELERLATAAEASLVGVGA